MQIRINTAFSSNIPTRKRNQNCPPLPQTAPISRVRVKIWIKNQLSQTEGSLKMMKYILRFIKTLHYLLSRYDITVEELRRRVSAPEHLNKVDMISYLRLAKNSARLLLEKYDIISSLHHRLSKHTILSKVSESECEDLATGIHDINMSYFPCRAVAQKSVTRIKEEEKTERGEKEQLEKRCKDLQTTRYGKF